MPQDHFISQTYLEHFVDPAIGGKLHVYGKVDRKYFPCRPSGVCKEKDGDINSAFLSTPDLLGRFRKIFEPAWTHTMSELAQGRFGSNDRFVIAGFMANFMTCTPAWRQVGMSIMNRHNEEFLTRKRKMAEQMTGHDDIPVAGIRMIEEGTIELDVDPDFIKAMNTRRLMDYTGALYHQEWHLLVNDTDYPFITSDNPVSCEHSPSRLFTRFFPLSPRLCVKVVCNRRDHPPFDPFHLPAGVVLREFVTPNLAKRLNRLTAQCADRFVFSSKKYGGIEKLVANAARHRVSVGFADAIDPRTGESYIRTSIKVGIPRRFKS